MSPWDEHTCIPFIYPVDKTYYAGLWNLAEGTVSFSEDPLFTLGGPTDRVYWDGGERFVYTSGTVKPLDSRVRVETMRVPEYRTGACPRYLLAAPSGSDSLFLVYHNSPDGWVLEIENHLLAGRVSLGSPTLAPGTSILGPVALEVDQDEVLVYFETSRWDVDVGTGTSAFVQGLVLARYRPASFGHPPVQWQMVNPDVPAFVGEGATVFSQFSGEIVVSTQGRVPESLDTVAGALRRKRRPKHLAKMARASSAPRD